MISQYLTGMQTAAGSNQEAFSEEEAYDLEEPTMKEVNYMGEPYGKTYNPSWRNHPNLSWKEQQKPQQGFNNNQGGRNQNRFNNRPAFPSSQGNMETSKQRLSNLATLVSSLTKTTHSFINEISNTEVNPREQCKAIIMEVEAKLEENGKASILALNASEKPLTGRSTPTSPGKLVLNASKDIPAGHLMPRMLEGLVFNASQGGQQGRSTPNKLTELSLNASQSTPLSA
ncbi:hypothetical protein AHAS_Ahas20G0175500 [Arachis hypogaea]